ncbi:anhydro-N-acetylmuramic acid kinase [Azospirillum thiophilum]|uniref:Anhydro-N-acetylmuramic acid kinase n=1 Tax=Azospirillum thiophilum TaxID=528244 RepID=A0AAC8VWC0_9PROT|nr:anhydro-N-acetylmuramic acid kinase [Azospirillum thiophilum]ALG70707.1 anhydro-N-acetylmuramic acid kinase [Azospirillum thiophilum]KJR65626.1 anhydro-N-acetylmuramic acid kinase [Azospirillum thiophilum]
MDIREGLRTVVGLMSGTSMDGIDAALLRTDGRDRVEALAFLTIPYDDGFRAALRGCLGGIGPVEAVERALTDAHADAVGRLLHQAGAAARDIDLIGFHGHTILHDPDNPDPGRRRTWQIGDGARLAAATGIAVVDDFRSADVAAGGQGAPLVPLFHRALAHGLPRPLAVLNIGGVANVSWIGPEPAEGEEAEGRGEAGVVACDTGPGNAPIDDWVLRHGLGRFDADGALAAAGRVDGPALAALMAHPYFDRPAPKSLDRDAFDPAPVAGLSAADGAATLTAFTASSVARVVPHLPAPPVRWLVCGGGRRNSTLMRMLADRLGVPVDPADLVGWDGDALEAQAFGYLAVRSRLGLPLSLPATTGVPAPTCGGAFHVPGPNI